MRLLPIIALCGCALAALVPGAAATAEQRINLHHGVVVHGGSCEPGPQIVIAGSSTYLDLHDQANTLMIPMEPGWPQGYVLEAQLDPVAGQPFTPTPGLIESLTPTPYHNLGNWYCQQALLRGMDSLVSAYAASARHFALHVPPELAGHSISLRVRHAGDSTERQSYATPPMRVISPCNASDSARIVATTIFEAWTARDPLRAMALADSMLALGWSDAMALQCAKVSAEHLERWDKMLAYLDRLYQDYDVFWVQIGTSQPPRLQQDAQRKPDVRAVYERKRAELLELETEPNKPVPAQFQHETR